MKTYLLKKGGSTEESFAILQISYPVGDIVTVTHSGNVETAPDTSGSWLYSCEEIGEYTVTDTSLVGVSQTVTITTKGQVETIVLSGQVVNYTMLYYLGDECTSVTGGWTNDGMKYGGVGINAITKNADNFYIPNNTRGAMTVNTFNLSSYNFIYINAKNQTSVSASHQPTTRLTQGKEFSTGQAFDLAQNNVKLIQGNDISSLTDTRYIGFYVSQSSLSGYFWAIWLTKQDDISSLSAYGTTISEIIGNASSLFANRNDVYKMVYNCTGDFLATALSTSAFVSTMQASENYDVVQANTHWAKFIALLSV